MKKFLLERKRLIRLFAPAIIGLIFIILCFVNIDQSVSLNESINSYIVRYDFAKVLELSTTTSQPPLYYVILKIWSHFMGFTDFSMHTLSAFLGASAIVFAFLWIKYKHGLTAAIFGSFLMAVSPMLVHYGQEIGPMSLLVFFVMSATYFLQLAIDNKGKSWWILYVVLMTLAVWTHYFAIVAIFAHLIYVKVTNKKSFVKEKMFIPFVLPLISILPWAQNIGAQFGRLWGNGISAASLMDYWTKTILYEQAGAVTGVFLLVATVATVITISLCVYYRKKANALLLLMFVPGLTFVVAPLWGIQTVLFAREKLSKKAKRKSKNYRRRATVAIVILVAFFTASNAIGVGNVLAKGVYDFETNRVATNKLLFENLLVLDNAQNLSIMVDSSDLYYELSLYMTKENDVHFVDEKVDYDNAKNAALKDSYVGKISNIDEFLKTRNAFWYVVADGGKKVEKIFDGWHETTSATFQFDDLGDRYQILKLERE